MRFRVLGTLEVRSAGGPCRLGAAKQRALLAMLLLNVNRPVDADRLTEALWPQGSPRTAPVALRTYVSALRQGLQLADRTALPRLVTVPAGYQLLCAPADLDLLAFEDLVGQGQRALTDGHPVLAAERLRRALGLWRGRPFEDVELESGSQLEVLRLEERRLAAHESWIESQLILGHHEDLLAELGALVAAQPLRERLWAQWMLALYRSGRQAEALCAYRDLHRILVHELGVEPSPLLRSLHEQILIDHTDLKAPAQIIAGRPGPAAVPRQLPADIGSFTGRERELTHVLALDRDRSEALVIGAIDGMAGIGKTALAVHAAHRLADRFVDGQLFIDLHGFSAGHPPVDPADALDRMLRSLGMSGAQIPGDLDARAALYRTRLAGKRVLIVLDNAATEDQVRPLLPGAPTCLVLITSRIRLTLADVQPLPLGVLSAHDAVALLISTAGAERLVGAPHHLLVRIVELCGYLPVAIRVAAARLRARSNWTVAHLIDRLSDRRHRLAELSAGGLSVSTAIDLSYHHLPAVAQRMYRLLGLHPGSDLDTHAAAALADVTARRAGQVLDCLIDAHLLEEPAPGRYRFHDLIRAHATTVAAHADTESDHLEARNRLFAHYADTAAVAMDVAYPFDSAHRPGIRHPMRPALTFHDQAQATTWLDTELPNLLAVAAGGRHADATHLSATLHRHLRIRAHYRHALALHDRALRAAQATDNANDELLTLCRIGDVQLMSGQFQKARENFEQAMTIALRTANRTGQLTALIGTGHVSFSQGQFPLATEHFTRALDIARATNDQERELEALRGLGRVHRKMSRHSQAAGHLQQAVEIALATGNRERELDLLWELGHARWLEGRRREGADFHKQALELARTMGNRAGELRALTGLAYVQLFQDQFRPATDHYEQILLLAREIGDRNSQFEALYGLGQVHRFTSRPEQAATHYRAALDIARDLGQPTDEARALNGLAATHRDTGHPEKAREHWQRALDLLTDLGLTGAEDLKVAEIRTHLNRTAGGGQSAACRYTGHPSDPTELAVRRDHS